MNLNQFTIGTEDAGAELIEFLKNVQPGDRLKLRINNGVSELEGTLIVDEHTGDRLAARVKMKGGQALGGREDMDEDADDEDSSEPQPAPKSGAGASAAAVLGLQKS